MDKGTLIPRRHHQNSTGSREAASPDFHVRREKARIFRGCDSRPATQVAPAGSNRSGGGGNETAEAFDVKGRYGDSASRQAVTCSERRAGLERRNVGADPPRKRGRPPSLGNWGAYPHEAIGTSGPTGVFGDGMSVHGDPTQHGKPQVERVRPATGGPRGPDRAAWGSGRVRTTDEAG